LKKLVGDGDQLGELLKIFVDNKIQNIPGIEGMTVFVERKVYASNAVKKSEDEEKHSENKKKIIEILREIKLEDFTDDTFSSAALGAYFKEQQ
ncbi:MAG: hypothetical protein GTN76_06190, partial [Candidatus Aenigmarchaeota archaeon]|nr:hypothetical protein [Candidatus Aenigmarchaeota archaeon]